MVAHAARGMEPFSSLLEKAVFRHWCCLPHAEAHSRVATRGGYDAGELAEHFDISKPSLSHHLATFRNAGLITDERHGQNIVYSLNTTIMQDLVGWFNYGHPRNRFWPVMAAVFHDDSCFCENTDPIQTVRTRKGFALRHHMALWDVIASCDIEGASDASIRNVVPNDFSDMLRQSQISHIFTTVAKAAQLYQRLCIPLLQTHGSDNVPMTRLPSTSPTNAGAKLPELVEAYSCVGRVASGKAVMQPE